MATSGGKPVLSATGIDIGTVDQGAGGSSAWKITAPVTGLVTVDQGNQGATPWIVAGSGVGSAAPALAFLEGALVKASALPAATADTNLVSVLSDKYGRQVVTPVTIRDLVGTTPTTISASTAETTIVAATASVFNDLVMLIVSNTSAGTNTRIDFRDTTGGAVLFSLFSVAGAPPVGFALPVPIPQTAVNTNWTAQCATSTTDVRIYAVYAKQR